MFLAANKSLRERKGIFFLLSLWLDGASKAARTTKLERRAARDSHHADGLVDPNFDLPNP
jgi:hypothetical protein